MSILPDLERPIVQAPMAGGPSTPALAAAVCAAGGLGFVAAGYLTPEAMRADIEEVDAAPLGVNLFVPGEREVDEEALAAYVRSLGPDARRYGVEVGDARWDDDGWEAKLELLHGDPPAVVSFTFGCPESEVVASLREAGSEVWCTVTNPDEARVAADGGVDALVLQGVEAGGHQGTFVEGGGDGFGILALIRLVAAQTELPLVAAGGIGDAGAVRAALVAGAGAVQPGTAFMLCPEAGTNPAHREAIASERPTALTRAFSGRPARGIVNRFMREHDADAPVAYPQIHYATSPIRAAARERGDADGFNLWAGQAHRLARELPAAEVVRELAAGT